MKFKQWIENQGGAAKVAARLGLNRVTVETWMQGKNSPTALRMRQIVKLARGAVSYEDIVLETTKGRR